MDPVPDILLLDRPITSEELSALVERFFEDMVKYVADLQREVIAIGGDLHADAEAVLLERGSRQRDLWGANYYPGRGPDACIEFTSLINIRPAQDNPSMELEREELRHTLRELTFRLVGRGEPLP
ncbi:MAG: DUF5674 family protein [Longimicrobiales bacterium]|nr:DUF5674 family protein [Longimicrobiales bacterium]